MTTGFTPQPPAAQARPVAPREVVTGFLGALAAGDLDTAAPLLAERVDYVNVGMPAIRGRRAVIRALAVFARTGSFEVYLHALATDAGTVLTDRTDVLVFGRLRWQFWVAGRFDVADGEITLWRDSFDYVDVMVALARGLLGAVVPALAPAPPSSPRVAPGRH